MIDLVQQLAQVPDEGPGWTNLLYLLILIVVPVVNAIKDKFVKRAQAKADRAETEGLPSAKLLPSRRESAFPAARPLEISGDAGCFIELPEVPTAKPATPHRRRGARPDDATPGRPPLPTPRLRPSDRAEPPVLTLAPTPQPKTPRKRAVAESKTRGLADVHEADPRVDIEVAAPNVDVHQAAPHDVIHEVSPHYAIQQDAARSRSQSDPADALIDAGLVGLALMGRALTPAEMRRAVALREILDLPVALRGPGGWT